MVDDLHRRLAEALRTCAARFERCCIASGSGPEYAAEAVRFYHGVLAEYDDALAAESAAREQATEKMMETRHD